MSKIAGIIIKYGEYRYDDFGCWQGFNLTEDEENKIWDILSKHGTEGYSVRGTREEIAEEIGEW